MLVRLFTAITSIVVMLNYAGIGEIRRAEYPLAREHDD